MPTKATIVYGDKFHLYQELGDNKNIYLQLDELVLPDVETSLTASIPIEIWEQIKEGSLIRTNLLDLSDTDLETMAHDRVVQDIKDAKTAPEFLVKIWGADRPFDEQYNKLLSELKSERDLQKDQQVQIAELRNQADNIARLENTEGHDRVMLEMSVEPSDWGESGCSALRMPIVKWEVARGVTSTKSSDGRLVYG